MPAKTLYLLVLLAPVLFGRVAVGQQADNSTENPAFTVFEYRVGGNSVLSNRQIETAVYAYLGPDKTIDDVEDARQNLETAYRDAGFSAALVSIPEQTVDAGIVRLEVVEGTVGRVRVTDARYVSGRQVRAQAASVQPGQPLFFPDLQDDLQAINRLSADRSVTPILKPGRSPGAVDLDLRVDDSLPLHGFFDINDQFTPDTEELRATVGLSYDNLFQRFHSLSVQYTTAPEQRSDTEILAATYLWRFANSPNVLALYGVDTNSDVATVGDLSVLGDGRIFGARFVAPLQGSGAFYHSLTVGADFKDFNEIIGEDLETPIAYTNLSTQYAFGWNGDSYISSYNIGANFGARPLGNTPEEFENKRFRAEPNYFYLRLGTEQLKRIWGGVGLYGRIQGQYSPEPLIGNEQFAAGGANTVRGYLEAERLGDFGVVANVEVRTPNFGASLWDKIDDFYLLAFYDAATLGIHNALPGQDPNFELYSTGVGFRLSMQPGLLASLDWALPLRDSLNVQSSEERFHFSFRWGF